MCLLKSLLDQNLIVIYYKFNGDFKNHVKFERTEKKKKKKKRVLLVLLSKDSCNCKEWRALKSSLKAKENRVDFEK